MKRHQSTRLLMAAAALAPMSAITQAQSPHSSPPNPQSSATVNSVVTDGKGTITIVVETDGKKEVRTLNLNSGDPVKLAEQLVEELKSRGGATASPAKRKMTYLGVMLAEPAPSPGDPFGYGLRKDGGPPAAAAPAAKGLPPGTGLPITGVSSGSPAEKAGLQGGDVLAKLDDQILINPAQFTTLVRHKNDGDTIKLAIVRNGEPKQIDVTLAAREEEDSPFAYSPGGHGGSGKMFLHPGKEGRVLRLEKDGRLLEEWVEGDEKLKKRHEAPPSWEKALRDAADVKEKAADQWKKQLSDWREQWSATQEKTAADFRRAMEKMGEEIRKATEAALKAQEAARRAVEEAKQKHNEQQHIDEKAPPPPIAEKNDPEQPKKSERQ